MRANETDNVPRKEIVWLAYGWTVIIHSFTFLSLKEEAEFKVKMG